MTDKMDLQMFSFFSKLEKVHHMLHGLRLLIPYFNFI